MLEKIGAICFLVGLFFSVIGYFLNNTKLILTGNMVLLITATVAGFLYIRFYLTFPEKNLDGVCIEKKELPVYCLLKFKTGAYGIYKGRADLRTASKVKPGDKVKIKVKGNIVLELERIS